jgi:hypothetical protein
VTDADLADWCAEHLGAAPERELFRSAQVSVVVGLRLTDGREVVVKTRPDPTGRVPTCVAAQAHVAKTGFPCATPLTAATRVGERAAHAEAYVSGGDLLRGESADVARKYAEVFADLMGALDGLRLPAPLPSPNWVGWDHARPDSPWPAFPPADARDQRVIPEFVVEATRRASARIIAADLPRVLGHADLEAQNLRWVDGVIHVVHDWDSVAWLPEAALVGAAAGTFVGAEIPTLAPIEATEAFLETYQDKRGHRFGRDESEVAWAASIWPSAHNARAEALWGQRPVALTAVEAQWEERLRRAGCRAM